MFQSTRVNCCLMLWSAFNRVQLRGVVKLFKDYKIVLQEPFLNDILEPMWLTCCPNCDGIGVLVDSIITHAPWCINVLMVLYLPTLKILLMHSQMYIVSIVTVSHHTRQSSMSNLFIHDVRSGSAKRTFSYSGAVLWNTLPEYIQKQQQCCQFQNELLEGL